MDLMIRFAFIYQYRYNDERCARKEKHGAGRIDRSMEYTYSVWYSRNYRYVVYYVRNLFDWRSCIVLAVLLGPLRENRNRGAGVSILAWYLLSQNPNA